MLDISRSIDEQDDAQSSPRHEGYAAISVHSSLKDFIKSSTLRPKSNEISNVSDSDYFARSNIDKEDSAICRDDVNPT